MLIELLDLNSLFVGCWIGLIVGIVCGAYLIDEGDQYAACATKNGGPEV